MNACCRVVKDGQGLGGFLNPPLHPNHTHVIVMAGGGLLCVEVAVRQREEYSYVDERTYEDAKRLLDEWEANKLPLDHPSIVMWLAQVNRHFDGTPLGEAFIQMYYPEYTGEANETRQIPDADR